MNKQEIKRLVIDTFKHITRSEISENALAGLAEYIATQVINERV